MKHLLLLLFGFLFILQSTELFCQLEKNTTETIYFNRKWESCEKAKAKYKRQIIVKDSLIEITDTKLNGTLQSDGLVLNTQESLDELRQVGDFELNMIGQIRYYRRNGHLHITVNYTPFHPLYGVSEEYKSLLDSVHTSSTELDSITFETLYRRNGNINHVGFLLNDEFEHGCWLQIDKRRNKVASLIPFDHGLIQGYYIWFYENDAIYLIAQYEKDNKHGEQKKYTSNGILKQVKTYYYGQHISTINY